MPTISKPKLQILTDLPRGYKKSDSGQCEIINTIIFEPKSFKHSRDTNNGSLLIIKGQIEMKTKAGASYSAKKLIINDDKYHSLANELITRKIEYDNQKIRYKFEICTMHTPFEPDDYEVEIKSSYEYIEKQSLFND